MEDKIEWNTTQDPKEEEKESNDEEVIDVDDPTANSVPPISEPFPLDVDEVMDAHDYEYCLKHFKEAKSAASVLLSYFGLYFPDDGVFWLQCASEILEMAEFYEPVRIELGYFERLRKNGMGELADMLENKGKRPDRVPDGPLWSEAEEFLSTYLIQQFGNGKLSKGDIGTLLFCLFSHNDIARQEMEETMLATTRSSFVDDKITHKVLIDSIGSNWKTLQSIYVPALTERGCNFTFPFEVGDFLRTVEGFHYGHQMYINTTAVLRVVGKQGGSMSVEDAAGNKNDFYILTWCHFPILRKIEVYEPPDAVYRGVQYPTNPVRLFRNSFFSKNGKVYTAIRLRMEPYDYLFVSGIDRNNNKFNTVYHFSEDDHLRLPDGDVFFKLEPDEAERLKLR